MPIGNLDAKPRGEAIERVSGKVGLGDLGQKTRVQRARPRPSDPCALALAFQHGEVEAKIMSDHDSPAQEGGNFRPHFAKGRSLENGGVVNVVDRGCRWRNRYSWIDAPPKYIGGLKPAADDPYARDFDNPRFKRIEPGRLRIDHHSIEGDQRSGIGADGHRVTSLADASEPDSPVAC